MINNLNIRHKLYDVTLIELWFYYTRLMKDVLEDRKEANSLQST